MLASANPCLSTTVFIFVSISGTFLDASKRLITAFGVNWPEAKPICIVFLKSVFARSSNSSLAISLNTLTASEASLYKLSIDVPIALLKFSVDI